MRFEEKHIGAFAVLKNDLHSFGFEKVLKQKGSTGQIIAIQSFHNEATLKIGKRNYKISQNDLDLV